MPDHEFEKNIQEKMAELRLPPSAPVWDRVEQQLNKKDKRRRSLLWVPFFLAVAVGMYFLINRPAQPAVEKYEAGIPAPGAESHTTVKKPLSEIAKKDQVHPADGVVKDPMRELDTTAGIERPASVKTLSEVPVLRSSRNRVSASRNTNNVLRPQGKPGVIFHSQDQVKKKDIEENGTGLTAVDLNGTEQSPLREPVPSRINTNLESFRAIDIEGEIKRPLLKETEWKGASRKRRSLEFGVALSIGRSHINNGKLPSLFVNAMALSDMSDRSGQPSFSTGSGSPPAAIIIPPSRLKAGVGFTAGGYIKKQLTRSVQLSLGLNYKLYSTVNTLGVSKDTLLTPNNSNVQLEPVNFVYTTGRSNEYTNYFHFIELPVIAEGRILKGKLPLFWNAGASYSRLVASNALHFDSSQRLYYKQNKFLQKNQLSLHAALTTKFFLRSRRPLAVGPEFTYSVSNLLVRKNDNAKHFMYLGLKTSMPLNN